MSRETAMKRVYAALLVLAFLLTSCTQPAQVPASLPPSASEISPPAPEEGVHTEPFGLSAEDTRDLKYAEIPGADPNLTSLDIYLPESGHEHPIVVYFHGGGWKAGDKNNVGYKPEAFTRKGYVFVSVNYRLSPEVQHPVHVQDVARAIAWVYKNAAKFEGAPDHIFLMGHSAGAHLAALVAVDGRYLEAEGLTLNMLKGVILIDGGGYDIDGMIELAPRLYTIYYKDAFGDDPVVWEDASPITHIAAGKGIPPFLIIHMGRLKISSLPAQWMFETLQQAGVYAKVIYPRGKNHYTVNQDIGKSGDEATRQVFDFLSDYRKRG